VKFLVDAQLPKSLSDLLVSKGYDSIHTIDLPNGNATKDKEIIRISEEESRVVVSKDDDFLQSYLIKELPAKLILIKTGNIHNAELNKIFDTNIDRITTMLETNSLIEITNNEIIVHLRKV
jgi:predicted nuclease of predicted toxin-antitoxin system